MTDTNENSFQATVDRIVAKYKPILDQISKDGDAIGKDFKTPGDLGVVVGADIKVDWADVKISFDLPSVKIEDKRISFDLPEVTKLEKKISFDVPSTRTVLKKVGQYPEVHGWKIVWKDILVEVPEFYMKRVDIVYELPSVTMKRQELVIGIPQFSTQRQEWVLTLPQFTVVNISAKAAEMKKKGDELQAQAQEIAKQMNIEISAEMAKMTGASLATALDGKNNVSNSYNQALGTIKGAIDDLQSQGCDPIKIPTDNGDVNLRKVFDNVEADKARAIAEIDVSIALIN